MTRFKFKLATLLRVREAVRDERRAQLAEALRAEEILQEQQAEVRRELDFLLDSMRDQTRPGAVNVDMLHESSRYALLLRAQGQALAKQQTTIQAEVERRRLLLVESDRQVRVVEKLRERKLEEFNSEEERREGQRLDEAGAILVRRREATA